MTFSNVIRFVVTAVTNLSSGCECNLPRHGMSDKHVGGGFDAEEVTQSDDHENRKIDVLLGTDEIIHRHDVLMARPNSEARM